MNYELDILAALTQLPEPTTQDIVTATDISERKVQNVIKTLQNDLKIEIKKVKHGRYIRYAIIGWGVFETGDYLRQVLANRPLNKNRKSCVKITKSVFYESVKMSNYKESSRLEGISIQMFEASASTKQLNSTKKYALVKKYLNYKNMSK